jgi:transposase
VLSMPCSTRRVVGGIDTHKDLHFAAVVDISGEVLGQRAFATTRQRYRALLKWMASFGRVAKVAVEQTGSYGAGIARHLALAGSRCSRSPAPTRPTVAPAARTT